MRMCLAYTGNHFDATDLLQETFINVWRGLQNFRGDAKLSTWIYRIAVNTSLAYIRSGKKRAATSYGEIPELADDDSAKEKEHQLKKLRSAIQQLAETDRLIISLVLEEIPYEEIAQIAGISEGNLRVKIHRIKQQLTKLFFAHE